jgi:hypothetical protein
MTGEHPPASRWCIAAFGFGAVSLAVGIVAVCADWRELFVVWSFLALLALVTTVAGLVEVSRHRGRVGGYNLALGGLAFPALFYGLMVLQISHDSQIRSGLSQTTNNLWQIGYAFHAYHDVYKCLPSAAICDAAGKPLLSWRVAILPAVEAKGLYDEFNLDEPWDSPHNIKLLERMPHVYEVELRDTPKPGMTYFQVFVGPGTPFEPGLVCKIPQSFPDGTSNTFLVVEAGDAVPWTKPADLVYDPDQPLPPLGGIRPRGRLSVADLFGFGAPRREEMAVLLADGTHRRIDMKKISEQTLRRAIVRNDG